MKDASLQFVRKISVELTGNRIGNDKDYFIENRLRPLAGQLKFGSVEELVDHARLARDQQLNLEIAEALLIHETSFFRDNQPFEEIKLILQSLAKNRSRLSLWSAGCASGQEAYSLAMVCREAQLDGVQITVFGSDICEGLIARARNGEFHQLEISRGLSSARMSRFFRAQEQRWVVEPQLKSMVDFRAINLISTWPHLPKMDLVLLRNVMIYLEPEKITEVTSKVHDLLNPDGYFLVGATESSLVPNDLFTTVDRSGSYFHQKRKHAESANHSSHSSARIEISSRGPSL